MNYLLQTSLFSLLAKPSKVSVDEMKNAYEVFVNDITQQQSEMSYENLFRRLTIARIELVSLQALSQDEQGGKCARKTVFHYGNCPS